MAKVDVVVPCYNYGHFLEACVQSVLEQKGVEVRVFVIDDASTDQSGSVAASLAQRDSRVQLISLPENVGMIRAVNMALREIKGEYFVKLDADDLLSPGSLERSVALLERYPGVGFVYGRPHVFFEHGSPVVPGRPCWSVWSAAQWVAARGSSYATVWRGAEWLTLRYKRAVSCISQPEAVIRTSILRTVGEYNVALPHTSDMEMWLRLAAVSDVGRVNRFVQGYYRIHSNSMQRTVHAGLLTDLVGRREAFISALSAAGDLVRDAASLEAEVRKKLAAEALDNACRAFDRNQAHAVPVDKLVEFATTTFTDATTLRQWSALQRRRRRGRTNHWPLSSVAARVVRRCRREINYWRWIRTGV